MLSSSLWRLDKFWPGQIKGWRRCLLMCNENKQTKQLRFLFIVWFKTQAQHLNANKANKTQALQKPKQIAYIITCDIN